MFIGACNSYRCYLQNADFIGVLCIWKATLLSLIWPIGRNKVGTRLTTNSQ